RTKAAVRACSAALASTREVRASCPSPCPSPMRAPPLPSRARRCRMVTIVPGVGGGPEPTALGAGPIQGPAGRGPPRRARVDVNDTSLEGQVALVNGPAGREPLKPDVDGAARAAAWQPV